MACGCWGLGLSRAVLVIGGADNRPEVSELGAWPERLTPTAIAGVLLPQSHGGHYRGRLAEIAMLVFSHSPPPPTARDFQQPYEPLVLGLIAGWARMALADPAGENAVLLAPPLVDLIGTRLERRITHELGISWPLEPSKP